MLGVFQNVFRASFNVFRNSTNTNRFAHAWLGTRLPPRTQGRSFVVVFQLGALQPLTAGPAVPSSSGPEEQ